MLSNQEMIVVGRWYVQRAVRWHYELKFYIDQNRITCFCPIYF